MSIFSSMYTALSELKFYKLSEESLVYKELMAYDAGFSLIKAFLLDTLTDAFITTCSPERLKEWENLLNIPFASSVPIETRREIVLYKLAVAPNDFSLSGMINSIRSTGVEAEITENPLFSKLTVKIARIFGQSDNLDIIKRQIYDILPAHLNTEFDMGSLTWEDFDAKDYSFGTLDSKDFTWEYFDLSGAML